MDFVDVSHVVLFDFPRDGIEVRRRTLARATPSCLYRVRRHAPSCAPRDIACRAVPPAPCSHPHAPSLALALQYLRRVGRVTRGARSPGRVTSFVLGRQLMYARTLMKINREGGTIDLETHGSRAEL